MTYDMYDLLPCLAETNNTLVLVVTSITEKYVVFSPTLDSSLQFLFRLGSFLGGFAMLHTIPHIYTWKMPSTTV